MISSRTGPHRFGHGDIICFSVILRSEDASNVQERFLSNVNRTVVLGVFQVQVAEC